MTSIANLGAEDYISLTTFKRDGSAVATPVWVMSDETHLYLITEADSGKAKRLRNFSRVMVAPCDMRGRITGASVDATAELLDAAGTAQVQQLMRAKYGLTARVFDGLGFAKRQWSRLRRRPAGGDRIGIRITLATPRLGPAGPS